MPVYPRIAAVGDTAVVVEFGTTIDPLINDRVMACARALQRLALPGIVDIVPTYRSVTVYFDLMDVDPAALRKCLQDLAKSLPPGSDCASRLVRIPVLYGGEYGPDLQDVAAYANLSIDEVIATHWSTEYRVYMLGFNPGFPYLGIVPSAIAMPRLMTPRRKVPAGSVGIAGSQTGIYPVESPGGWRLIGRTPLKLYDPTRPKPFLFHPHDRVRFVRVDQDRYDRLNREER